MLIILVSSVGKPDSPIGIYVKPWSVGFRRPMLYESSRFKQDIDICLAICFVCCKDMQCRYVSISPNQGRCYPQF